jgi:hypothetical protein
MQLATYELTMWSLRSSDSNIWPGGFTAAMWTVVPSSFVKSEPGRNWDTFSDAGWDPGWSDAAVAFVR